MDAGFEAAMSFSLTDRRKTHPHCIIFLWWIVLSECFEKRSLVVPIGRQVMLLAPIGG